MVDPAVALTAFAALVVVCAAVFWPRIGLWARAARIVRLTERVRLEDALKHVYTWEQAGRTSTPESLAGRLEVSPSQAARLLVRLSELGLVHTGQNGTSLTQEGRESALRLVRSHRLWERYLADRTGVPAGEWHDEAERMEHSLSAEQAEALSSRLGHPQWDPHGDPIPSASGEMPEVDALTLAGCEPGALVEVVHLEDEPKDVFDGILRKGIGLGTRLEVVDRSDRGVRLQLGERVFSLDGIEARNVSVRELPEGAEGTAPFKTLAVLEPGEVGRVVGLSPQCRGQQRRRLLDLGVVEGTEITAAFRSAGGDPVAYSIRGALIALRRGQAEWIRIERVPSEAAVEAEA